MLILLGLGSVGLGLLVGRLYSFLAVLLVSPLVWLLAAGLVWREMGPLGGVFGGLVALAALHLSFVLGAGLRLMQGRRLRARRIGRVAQEGGALSAPRVQSKS